MGADFRCRITGLDELNRRLTEEAPRIAKLVVRRAGKRAGEIWQAAMEQGAPHRSGFLGEHIAITSRSSSKDDTLTVSVGPSKQAFYGGFDEFGTSRMAAQPFMRPAFEAHQEDVLRVFADELWNSLKDLEEK